MSKSILEALYYGKIRPWENRIEHSPERKELEESITDERNHFKEIMSDDEYQRFQTYENLFLQALSDTEVNIFSNGFIVGSLLVLEIMTGKEAVLNE